jgi:Domain of unknown function (DUF4234)
MSEHNQGPTGDGPAQQPYHPPPASPPGGYLPAPYGSYPVVGGPAQIGSTRSTGLAMFLYVITFGIYGLYWFYVVHDEMKRHKGSGLGGGLALLLAFLVGFVMPYITSSEAGELYERRGQPKPVSGLTGLWYFPGALILVGPIVWFVKTNGAINSYWRSVGAL